LAKVIMMKLEGELASALAPPTGCHCQQAMPICKGVYPGSTLITPDQGLRVTLTPSPPARGVRKCGSRSGVAPEARGALSTIAALRRARIRSQRGFTYVLAKAFAHT